MKKKILSFLTAVLMTVTFGCSDKDNESTKSAETIVFSSSGGTYSKGMIYNFGIDSPTMFLDFETMEKAPLCAVPNCTHTVSSCLGMMVGKNPVIYNDYVYYFVSDSGYEEVPEGHQFYMKTTLYKAKLDSSETEKVVEFTDCVPNESYNCIVLIDNTIWFIGDDMNPIPENVMDDSWIPSSDTQGSHFVCSINLDTGEYKNFGSITDEDKQYACRAQSNAANIRGLYNGKLVIDYYYAFRDMEDAVMGEYNPADYVKFMSFEFDTETETLSESERVKPLKAWDDWYIGHDFATETITVIYNGEEKVYDSGDLGVNVFLLNGKLFCHESWIDLKDDSVHPLGEELSDFISVAYYNDCYIFLKQNGKAVKITEEELLALE